MRNSPDHWPGDALGCTLLFWQHLRGMAFVHHFAFAGKGAGSDHGELMVLYLGALLTLSIAGPGAASLDRILTRDPGK